MAYVAQYTKAAGHIRQRLLLKAKRMVMAKKSFIIIILCCVPVRNESIEFFWLDVASKLSE